MLMSAPMARAKSPDDSKPKWKRFNAYLMPAQMDWLHRTRRRYSAESQRDVGGTDLVRIALAELEKLDWERLRKVIDRHLAENE